LGLSNISGDKAEINCHCSFFLKKNPHPKVGIKEVIIPSGLSDTGLVFGVFNLKPIVAYAKANPLVNKATKEVSDPLDMGALCCAKVIKHIIFAPHKGINGV
jgi:hypothetical protein